MVLERRRAAAPAFRTQVPSLYGTPIPPQTAGPSSIGVLPQHAWMSVFRVKTVYNEYLECEGWNPWIHGYQMDVNVARPFDLRDAEHDDGAGEVVEKVRWPDLANPGGPDIEHTIEKVQHQLRTVDGAIEEIYPPYYNGCLIVAARMSGKLGDTVTSQRTDDDGLSQTVAEMPVPDEYPYKQLYDAQGRPIFWQDMNVAGRHWTVGNLVGGKIYGAHPGRGIVFDLRLGTWNENGNDWDYEEDPSAVGIDWRYGVPYPDAVAPAGATGLFQARRSWEHSVIYECVSLDCEAP